MAKATSVDVPQAVNLDTGETVNLDRLKKEIKEELFKEFNSLINELHDRINDLKVRIDDVEDTEDNNSYEADGVITHIESDYLLQNKELEQLKEQNTKRG